MTLLFAAAVATSTHYCICRHGYEAALLSELTRAGHSATSPCAAVARVVSTEGGALPSPAYAMQVLPHVAEVGAPSIKALANAAAIAIGADDDGSGDGVLTAMVRSRLELLEAAPRGSLQIHALVPDRLRGVPPARARLLCRCENVADRLRSTLRVRFAAARPLKAADLAVEDTEGAAEDTPPPPPPPPQLLLQLLMLEPELVVVSLALRSAHASGIGEWPVAAPGGYVDCSLEGDLPSSAYRKLLESFELMRVRPRRRDTCVDLGACPGGWTAALVRQCGARVTAVDRQPLSAELMSDRDVEFVQGDAFAFAPANGARVDWMVSDVIAFPERCVALIDSWCKQGWARRMVVTMKFTGETPDFDAIDEARRAAETRGFRSRCMHHFSNKNEVSLMLVQAAENVM